jgi:putative ABC transport system substrate-binding protein
MKKIFIGLAVGAMLFALCASAQAQQPKKVPRIVYLSASSGSANAARYEAFRQGLRDLGYVEGKNIVVQWRHAEGKPDHFPGLAAELVRRKVDVIVSSGSITTRSAKEATSTIPIVMTQIPIRLEMGSSKAWRGPAETLPDYQTLSES